MQRMVSFAAVALAVMLVGCEFEPPMVTRIAPSPLVRGSYTGDGSCTFTLDLDDQTASESADAPTTVAIGETGVPILGSREILPGDVTTLSTAGIDARWTATRVVTDVDGVVVSSTGFINFDLGEGQSLRVFGPKTDAYVPNGFGGITYTLNSTGSSAGAVEGSLNVEIDCRWELTGDTLLSGAATSADILQLPGAADRNPIERMETVELRVGGASLDDFDGTELPVRAWIADDATERAKGLMFVGIDEMQPFDDGFERGMWFVFTSDQLGGFFMRNTYINLDIAFVNVDGMIVDTFTMTALDETTVRPSGLYRYALELREGVLTREGITAGQFVQIPEAILKRAQ